MCCALCESVLCAKLESFQCVERLRVFCATWCGLQCAVCSVQCAVCSVQCAVCSVQYAVRSLRCAVCSVQSAVCSVLWAVCSVQSVVCSVQCAVCSVQSCDQSFLEYLTSPNKSSYTNIKFERQSRVAKPSLIIFQPTKCKIKVWGMNSILKKAKGT